MIVTSIRPRRDPQHPALYAALKRLVAAEQAGGLRLTPPVLEALGAEHGVDLDGVIETFEHLGRDLAAEAAELRLYRNRREGAA
jgi:hypothetical protein